MVQDGEPTLPPNKFVEGTITKGDTSLTVDSDGNVTVSSWKGATANRPSIPMVRAIDFKTGDSLRLVVKKISGTMSVQQYCEIWVNSFKVMSNELWGTGTTAIDKTITATADANSVYFTMNNKTGTANFSSYKFKVEIYVNGTKKFPEV